MAVRMAGNYSMSIEEYRYEKIRMLEDDFCIDLSDDELDHFNSLETEGDIDAYAHDILVERL